MSDVAGIVMTMELGKTGQPTRIANVATTAELLAHGLSERRIRTLVQHGDLVAIRRGVYADGPQVRGLRDRRGGGQPLAIAAAVAAVGPAAVVSHGSAAHLHDIAQLRDQHFRVTLTCPPERSWRSRNGIKIYEASLPTRHVAHVAGLPVTTPARTVVDLARTLPFKAGVVAADSALHRRLATKDDLLEVLASCARWRGTRTAAEVVDFADGLSESPLESLARVAFRDCGLPPPRLQALIGDTDDVARVDFYWPRYRTIAEVDGALKYTHTSRVTVQLERDSWLRSLGYEVVHFTWQDITTVPELVAGRIRQAFRRGELLADGRRAAPASRASEPRRRP